VIEAYTGTVQVDREVDEGGHNRWGSGEGRITEVEFRDGEGRPTTRLHCGERATLRLHYEMRSAIERPVFGLAINTVDGFLVTGPNSRDVDCVPEKLDGTGTVEVMFDPVRLLPGTYDLTVSLYDYSCLHPYDFRQAVLRFDVERGPVREEFGVVALGGQWQIGDLVSER
jgi:ABC-2 type transport system ATP-binding protein